VRTGIVHRCEGGLTSWFPWQFANPHAHTPSDLDAAFADFLRVDVANGDASQDTVRNYHNAP